MKQKTELVRRLLGLELDLDVIILIALWALNYKIAFWIFTGLFVINALVTAHRIQKMED